MASTYHQVYLQTVFAVKYREVEALNTTTEVELEINWGMRNPVLTAKVLMRCKGRRKERGERSFRNQRFLELKFPKEI